MVTFKEYVPTERTFVLELTETEAVLIRDILARFNSVGSSSVISSGIYNAIANEISYSPGFKVVTPDDPDRSVVLQLGRM